LNYVDIVKFYIYNERVVKVSQQQDVTKKIKEIIQDETKIQIRTLHIEKKRIWREINAADVIRVLKSGKVESIRNNDTIIWRGNDSDRRTIDLQRSLLDVDGAVTIFVSDAVTVFIATAYDPTVRDERVKAEWLVQNPDYEMVSGGEVRRKVQVFKKR
jgi:hypothetical protein